MTALNAAHLYIGLNILLLVFLTFHVINRRRAAKVTLGTGGDDDLERRVRAHANAAETMPLMLIGLYALAAQGMPALYIHLLGAAFTGGRVFHAIGVAGGVLPARMVGMLLTLISLILAAAMLVVHAVLPAFHGPA